MVCLMGSLAKVQTVFLTAKVVSTPPYSTIGYFGSNRFTFADTDMSALLLDDYSQCWRPTFAATKDARRWN